MNYFNQSSKILTTSFLTVLTFMIIFAGCSDITDSDDSDSSDSTFPEFTQLFENDTEPWSTETDGEDWLGWCGSIDLKNGNSGELNPSAGSNYATIEHGACNDFWDGEFPGLTSAPATSKNPDLYSPEWPTSGYVQQLDIYLDPVYDAGNAELTFHDFLQRDTDYVFSFTTAIRDITTTEEEGELVVDYFESPVTKNDDNGEQLLVVNGEYSIEEAGWYTFRHLFDSNSEGNLSVEFELVRNGQTLYSETIDYSLLGVKTSDYEVDDLGSAHLWFVSIADGLELPIDQHILRHN